MKKKKLKTGLELLLRRFVSKEGAEKLGQETGRSDTAMSEIIEYAREWILSEYPYLVDSEDIGLLLAAWATECPKACIEDLNEDGLVDSADLGLLLGYWGPCPSSDTP